MSLSRQEIERAKFTFSIYDFEGTEKIDATQLGNALRAMGLCPTLRKISNLGGTRTRNEKFLSVEEFLAIYQQAKNEKEEQGTMEDYLECLSSHDKDRSGKLSVTTLSNLLQGYGEEKLDRDETEDIINECGQPWDGEVDYRDFVKNLLKGPEVRIPPALLIQQARANQDLDGETEANLEAEETMENRDKSGLKENESKKIREKVTGQDEGLDEGESTLPNNAPQANVATEGISRRTRDSVKSNAKNEDHYEETEQSESKRASRRNSTKPIRSRRGTSPDISLASDASTEKNPPLSKRGSLTAPGAHKMQTDASQDADSPTSGNPTRKSSKGKRDSVKSKSSIGGGDLHDERECSPDDVTCTSEISVAGGKSISRNDSQKSADLGRGASPDISWASEASTAGTDISKGKSSLKVKKDRNESGGKISPADVSCASADTPQPDLSKSRTSLKSKSSGSSTKSKRSDSKKEDEVKAKFQQPLISLKTDGLFGKKKE